MNNRILVFGYFGYCTNQLDGQTVKTRNIYQLLTDKGYGGANVKIFDTEVLKTSKTSIFKLVSLLFWCNKLIYLPAQNNLKYFFPSIFLISRFRRIDIIYIVIGGWLEEFLQTRKNYIKMIAKINAVLVESDSLRDNLIKRYKFRNVESFPNFRIHNFVPLFRYNHDLLRIVFMARIFRDKGIDVVFRLAEVIKRTVKEGQIEIHFYGPIMEGEEQYFNDELKKYNFVEYKGVLDPISIYSVLNQYDVLVLPTRYFNEGFPGTIIDAYIAGLPVIASNWRFIPEYIDNGGTGFLFDLKNEDEFYSQVFSLFHDRDKLLMMKRKAYERGKMYSSDIAWGKLKKYL